MASAVALGRADSGTEAKIPSTLSRFLVEVLSPTDSLVETRLKMVEYIENGARLAWLINPRRKQIEIYRPGQDVDVLDNPTSVSGEPVLPGFTLSLKSILG